MKSKAIKNLKEKVEKVLKDYPQARDSDVWLTIKLWTLYFPDYISRGGFLLNFRQHVVDTLAKRHKEKPENFTENEWLMYQNQSEIWLYMLKEFDQALLDGGHFIRTPDGSGQEKLVPKPMVELGKIMELPREDNIKRIRAKIQNEEHKYLPTTLEVARQRKINEEDWKAWSRNQDPLM